MSLQSAVSFASYTDAISLQRRDKYRLITLLLFWSMLELRVNSSLTMNFPPTQTYLRVDLADDIGAFLLSGILYKKQ